MSDNYEEELAALNLTKDEHEIASLVIDSEALKRWLISTREGKAIDREVKYRYSLALKKFEDCKATDIEAMQEAKMELEVAKKIFSIFSAIFTDGDRAEEILTNGE